MFIGESLMRNRIFTIATESNGGIKAVVETYLTSNVYQYYKHKWIVSHNSSSFFKRQLLFVRSILDTLINSFKGGSIFHIHMAMKGSFYRKIILVSICKLFNNKVILHLHGSEFEVFYKSANILTKRLIKFNFELSDKVLVLSESWAIFVKKTSPKADVSIINNYVNPIKFFKIENNNVDEFNLLFLGALGKRKGIYDLLRAISNLKNKKIILHCCGDGELEEVKNLAVNLGLKNKIIFHGWVDGDDKEYLLNKCDMFVLPSYNVGLPMAILEAMSIGKCVLSTYVGGIPEVIKNKVNGLLIEAGDIKALESSLAFGIENSNGIINELGEQGRLSYLKLYSPDVVIPKLHKIYRELNEKD